jgi:rod shape determining protein RodA
MLQLDRRYFIYFDWISFILTMTLSMIGLFFVFSATYSEHAPYSLFFKKQAIGLSIGFCIYFIFCCIDYTLLLRVGYFLYFFVTILLAITIAKGAIGMGAQRWIDLVFFRFQPSELAKLFFPPFFTYYLYTEPNAPIFKTRTFIPLFALLGLSSLLIKKQPDLGTAILVFCAGLILMWLAGLKNRVFFCLIIGFLVSAPITWKCLKPYQKNRVLVFFGAGDRHKERYQIEQSKIAIGSGGLWGKGFLQGTQNKLLFLPEGRTDFIFSVLCEEIGFFGALATLTLYLLLFFRICFLTSLLKDFFAQLLVCGLLLPIICATVINIGMVTNLLPVVGIPLPLISYGLTHSWITLASLGWCNGVLMRRFNYGKRYE